MRINGGHRAAVYASKRCKMKRFIAILLVACTIFFSGCYAHKTSDIEITCEELISAYEEAGFGVFHRESGEDENREYNCYVEITDYETDKTAYFHFHDTHEDAVAYFDEAPYASIGVWLFSLIWGEPTWLRCKAYNQISIEYTSAKLYRPFKKLIREKRYGF